MFKFFATRRFKLIDPKQLDVNKYAGNILKGCVLEVDLEYPKEKRDLHNDFLLALNEIKIKIELLSEYQLKITDLYKIRIDNVKKLVLNCFVKENYVFHYENLQLYLILGLKLKKMHRVLNFNQSH